MKRDHHIFIRLFWTGLFFSMVLIKGYPQFYDNGQEPAGLKWDQINTRHYRILFSEDFSGEAQRLANLLDYTYDYVDYSLHSKPRKITVVVHDQGAVSNGMVVWAPRRVELYTVPDPASYPDEALNQLAFHELRHVVQMEKLHHGFSKILSYAVGDLAAGGLAIMIPPWYMEGDAVTSETLLSHSGRGRLPSFEMGLRALSIERGKVFSYDKSLMDSYKDYIPGKYEYGYQVVAYSRKKYGSGLWDKALTRIAKSPYTINPVNLSLYKQAKLTKRKLYDSTFLYLHNKWTQKDKENTPSSFKKINTARKRSYTSYRFPRYVNDTLILAEKSGIDQINQFVLIDPRGKEKVIHIPGYYEPVRLSVASGKIVWAETIYDERWYNRSFSDIKIYDIHEGKEYRLTRRARYFAPDISPDGNSIAAVRIETNNKCFLDILGLPLGKLVQTDSISGNVTFFKPTWEDNHRILVIVLTNKGKSIRELDLQTGKWRIRVPSSFNDIQSVCSNGRYIFFQSTYSGIDNIYALDTLTQKIWQVTRSRFGASDVSMSTNGNKIAYSDYSSHGYDLAEVGIHPSRWIPLSEAKDLSLHLCDSLLSQEKGVIEDGDIPDTLYPVSSYSKFSHLIKIHSWLPFYFDYDHFGIENIPVYPGFILYSQNYLSTLEGSVGYAYKDHEHQLITSVTYKGQYPVIRLNNSFGGEPVVYRDSTSLPLLGKMPSRNDFFLQVYLPLNLTTNRYNRGIDPSVDFRYTNSFIWTDRLQDYKKGRMLLSYRFYAYNLLKMAHRDILPRLGYTVDIGYLSAPWDKENYGNKTYFRGTFYLPGLLKHHVLTLKAGYEKQNPGNFFYLNQLSYPKGYDYWLSEKLQLLTAKYTFPIVYPDFSIGSVLYFPRLYGEMFYESAHGDKNYNYLNHHYEKDNKSFLSYGGKLIFDVNFFRIEFPVGLGFWAAYLPETGSVKTGVSFNINIYGLHISRQRRPLLPTGPGGMLR